MNKRYFQYIAGPRIGEVLMFDKIIEEEGVIYLSFADGSRCNEEFILPLNETDRSGKLMAEVSDPKNVWIFEEEWIGRQEERWETNADGEKVCVVPFLPGRKIIKATPPKKTATKFGAISKFAEPSSELHLAQKIDTTDPVWLMMEKAKKFDTEITMDLVISLPSKALYDVAKESFDDGGKKVIEYIISNLDDTQLRQSLRAALTNAYEEEHNEMFDPVPETTPVSPVVPTVPTQLFEPEVIEPPVVGEPKIGKKEDLLGR